MSAGNKGDALADAQNQGPASSPKPAPRSAFWRLWAWPLLLGGLTALGLVSALFSDGGVGDWLAWLALGVPTAGCVWWGWLRKA